MAGKKRIRPNILIDEDCYFSIKNLSRDDFYELFMAVLEFGFERKEPSNLSGALEATYLLITKRMTRAQNRYDTCIKNGSKGGAPSGNQNAKKEKQPEFNQKTTKKQPEFNQSSTRIQPENNQETTLKTTKPSIETEIETEKENESFPPDNKINNIFFLSTTENASPKNYHGNKRKQFMPVSYEYHKNDSFGEMFVFIANTLLEIKEYVAIQKQIKFNGNTYKAKQVNQFLANKGKQLVEQLAFKLLNDTSIKNKPMYILGSLLSQ